MEKQKGAFSKKGKLETQTQRHPIAPSLAL